jgi:hypothetical protein
MRLSRCLTVAASWPASHDARLARPFFMFAHGPGRRERTEIHSVYSPPQTLTPQWHTQVIFDQFYKGNGEVGVNNRICA